MTLMLENEGGWIQCDWCSEPHGVDPPPSTWKVRVDEIPYTGPMVRCGRSSCRVGRNESGRWVGARAVVNNPEKYGVTVHA